MKCIIKTFQEVFSRIQRYRKKIAQFFDFEIDVLLKTY